MQGKRIAAVGVALLALSVGYPTVALAICRPDKVLLFVSSGVFAVVGASLLGQGVRQWRRGGTQVASAFKEEVEKELREE